MPFDRVMLRSNSVQPLIAFQCFSSCVLSGLPPEMMRACDRLHLRHRSSYQVRGSIYHAYNFQLTCLGIGYNDFLIPPPYIHASQINPNNHVPLHPSKPCTAMLLLLAAQPLLSMHARMLSTFPLLLLGLGYHIIIILLWMILLLL